MGLSRIISLNESEGSLASGRPREVGGVTTLLRFDAEELFPMTIRSTVTAFHISFPALRGPTGETDRPVVAEVVVEVVVVAVEEIQCFILLFDAL